MRMPTALRYAWQRSGRYRDLELCVAREQDPGLMPDVHPTVLVRRRVDRSDTHLTVAAWRRVNEHLATGRFRRPAITEKTMRASSRVDDLIYDLTCSTAWSRIVFGSSAR